MFGLDLRALRSTWTVFLFALVVLLVYLTGRTIVVFTLAVFLAHLLGPIIERIEKAIPDRILSRNATLALVYLLIILAIGAALAPVGSLVAEQAAALTAQLPTALHQDPLAKVALPEWLEPFRYQISGALQSLLSSFDLELVPVLRNLGASAASLLGSLLSVVLVPILSFFFLKDGALIYQGIVDFFPGEHRGLVEGILRDLHQLLVQYIRALMMLALLVLICYSAFLRLIGAPFAILLASIAAALEVIPIAGPLVASTLIVIVAFLGGFEHLGWIVVFLGVFRIVQDYVVSPFLMSAGVEVHPLLVLFGVLAGEQVAGVAGMFFSVPVIAALRIIVVRMRRKKVAEDYVKVG